MTVNLLTEHDLEFLSLTGGCTDSSESTPVKKPHCWKSHVTAHLESNVKVIHVYILKVLFKRLRLFNAIHCNNQRLYAAEMGKGVVFSRLRSKHLISLRNIFIQKNLM